MGYLRLLLIPFSLAYGLVVWIRNRCYDRGWFSSTSVSVPTIVVGNLAVGGTGKSPMVEYLIRLLAGTYRLATLSRGYGRETRGYLEVSTTHTAAQCGDEPLQFKRKFPQVTVAVCEDRVQGVKRLMETGHDVILLDDAFQHRALKPGLAILLFDFRTLQRPRLLLPAGNFRDMLAERRRADVMIVTKTPVSAESGEKDRIRRRLAAGQRAPVLFAGIGYGPLVPVSTAIADAVELDWDTSVLLVSGIANPVPLLEFLSERVGSVQQVAYPDHHPYTVSDVRRIKAAFDRLPPGRRLVLTTEKDAQRLWTPRLQPELASLPLYMIPIEVRFDGQDERVFRRIITEYCAGASRSG